MFFWPNRRGSIWNLFFTACWWENYSLMSLLFIMKMLIFIVFLYKKYCLLHTYHFHYYSTYLPNKISFSKIKLRTHSIYDLCIISLYSSLEENSMPIIMLVLPLLHLIDGLNNLSQNLPINIEFLTNIFLCCSNPISTGSYLVST